MSTSRLFPMLAVKDLGASLAFYRGLLGGEQIYQFPDEGEAVFITLRLGDSDIGLGLLTDDPPLHGQRQMPATGHRIELCANVDDLDGTVEAARAAGVPVLHEPSAMPWGERVAYIQDPDGNLVMLTEPA